MMGVMTTLSVRSGLVDSASVLTVFKDYDLRQVSEMSISREQHESVLDDEGGDPKVVGGYRRALTSQLREE